MYHYKHNTKFSLKSINYLNLLKYFFLMCMWVSVCVHGVFYISWLKALSNIQTVSRRMMTVVFILVHTLSFIFKMITMLRPYTSTITAASLAFIWISDLLHMPSFHPLICCQFKIFICNPVMSSKNVCRDINKSKFYLFVCFRKVKCKPLKTWQSTHLV